MKKTLRKAVAAMIMVLCAVISMTSCDNSYGADVNSIVTPVDPELKLISCKAIDNQFAGTGGVETRSSETSDGTFFATSKHQMVFTYGKDSIKREYTGVNKVKAYRVNRPRYATSIDIFKDAKFVENEPLSDGSISYSVNFADKGREFGFDLVEQTAYDTKTVEVKGKTFNTCQNQFVDRKFVNHEVIDLQKDSTEWRAYKVIFNFKYNLEEGPKKDCDFTVTIDKVWIPKQGETPDIPEEEHDVVLFEDKDHGFDFVNDSTSKAYFKLVRFYSNGKRVDGETISVLLKNKLTAPEYKVKTVSDLAWEKGQASAASAVKNGEAYEKSANIYVQPYKQLYTTRTSKCDAVFVGEYEGSAYYVDSLGKAHYFIEKDWSFEEAKDKEWTEKELEPTTEFNRLLLTSNIIGKFNNHKHSRKAEIELKANKNDADSEIQKYEYEDFGIKEVEKNEKYYTYCTQYAVYSDESRKKIGEIGTNLIMSVDTPDYQTKDVNDFNIQDQNAKPSNAIREDSREDEADNGTFKIQKYYQKYTTNTNKSECVFIAHYETDVVFVDKFGKEVDFKGISVSFADLGGKVSDLADKDDKQRKLLTSTITVTCSASTEGEEYKGEVEFRKSIEKEELLSWDKSQTLDYLGNGEWKSTTIVTYNYKLAGEKTETFEQNLIWRVVGEEKKQIILSEASADYKSIDLTQAETPSSSTNGNITVNTKTKNIYEDYTNLKDTYVQTTQTASYKATVEGKEISFDFLAPNSIAVAHKDGALVDGKRTETIDGTVYNVHDHKGTISYTVDNKTENASVEKEVLVVKPIEPFNPALGAPIGLVGATLSYEPGVGDNRQGAFHKTIVMKFENGFVIATTKSYGPKAYDFEPIAYLGIPTTAKLNSAALFNGKWEPALITMDGSGWVYTTIDGKTVNMSQNLAILADIKNFSGQNTAANNPYLNYTGKLENGVLNVYNHAGGLIFSIK